MDFVVESGFGNIRQVESRIGKGKQAANNVETAPDEGAGCSEAAALFEGVVFERFLAIVEIAFITSNVLRPRPIDLLHVDMLQPQLVVVLHHFPVALRVRRVFVP